MQPPQNPGSTSGKSHVAGDGVGREKSKVLSRFGSNSDLNIKLLPILSLSRTKEHGKSYRGQIINVFWKVEERVKENLGERVTRNQRIHIKWRNSL